MRKLHRILLLTIPVVAAVVSIGWALPSRAYQAQADTGCLRSSITSSQPNRTIIESSYRARVIEDPTPEAGKNSLEFVSCYTLNGRPVLLGRRANTHNPTKRLLNVGAVSTGTTLHKHTAIQFNCLISANTQTLTVVFDIPLNRGPTPYAN
ncbi:MAG: hypothetical protein ABFD54_10860 [Armatimonadota bacterium]|nr:hypothetical protein [bacterium]